jgi:hypothetical protein
VDDADVFYRPEVDANSGQSQCTAMLCEGILECIATSVVGLALLAYNSGGGGQHGEE